jgi:hypothetical protein
LLFKGFDELVDATFLQERHVHSLGYCGGGCFYLVLFYFILDEESVAEEHHNLNNRALTLDDHISKDAVAIQLLGRYDSMQFHRLKTPNHKGTLRCRGIQVNPAEPQGMMTRRAIVSRIPRGELSQSARDCRVNCFWLHELSSSGLVWSGLVWSGLFGVETRQQKPPHIPQQCAIARDNNSNNRVPTHSARSCQRLNA